MKEVVKSNLIFDRYTVEEIEYKLHQLPDQEVPINFLVNIAQPQVNFKDRNLAKLKITINVIGKQNEAVVLETKLTISGIFSGPELEDKKFKELVFVSGTATLFSIARGIIASYSSQAGPGIPSIVIPLTNIKQTIEKD